MNTPVDLDRIRHQAALRDWLQVCQDRISKRFPGVDINSNYWPIKSRYGTRMNDVRLGPLLAHLSDMHSSFSDVLRCVAAEIVLEEKHKVARTVLESLCLLRKTEAGTLFDLRLADIRRVESDLADEARAKRTSAERALYLLSRLSRDLDRLSAKGVIPRIVYSVPPDLRGEFLRLSAGHRSLRHEEKMSILDHQIEALSEAMNALFHDDARLSATDRVVLASLGLEMCAPSRVNEILCLSTDDRVTLEDYAVRTEHKDSDQIHAVHQMLITMKGSKGTQWGAKPILSFMIELFNHCLEVIVKHGERSRMLIKWYEKSPNALFLPRELEHLRGQDIDRRDLWQIVNLNANEVDNGKANSVNPLFAALKEKVNKVVNKRVKRINGRRVSRPVVDAIAWSDLEPFLIERVRSEMNHVRRVTVHNSYEGRLSKMLFLFDNDETPYLPGSLKYQTLSRRLKQTAAHKARRPQTVLMEPTIFEKLGITMPVDGKVQFAWILSHDVRRWLTTQALKAPERLSDVLINKWARRLDIHQLMRYDFRTADERAHQSAMPMAPELRDLTRALSSLHSAEDAYGLSTEIVTVLDAGVAVTSMDAIVSAVGDRPIAKTSDQLIIVYPSQYGACLHQHHETPCRAYSSCLPCDNNVVVKGHLPTNDKVRQRKDKLYRSIVLQLESLVIAHNRGVADEPDGLASHMLALVRKGLNSQDIAADLIERFDEVKHLIKDVSFANKLEEAFVATGMATRLDDPEVPSGALIKYHNPTRHAAPGLERALDAHGGRAELEARTRHVVEIYPEFASTSLGLKDERHLIESDDEEGDEGDEIAEAGNE